MSNFAGYCNDCGKGVMYKTLFGTLHLCLSPEERAAKAIQRQQMQVSGLIGARLNKLTQGAASKPYTHPSKSNPKESEGN